MSILSSLKQLFGYLSRRRRLQLAGLCLMLIVGALSEAATLGAVIPFLGVLANPDAVQGQGFAAWLFTMFGGLTANPLLLYSIVFSAAVLLSSALRLMINWFSFKFTFGLGADIGILVYQRTLQQPYQWHVSKNTSEILAGIQKVNVVTSDVIVRLMQGTVAAVISVAIILALMVIDPLTALAAGLGFSLLYIITTIFARRAFLHNGRIVARNETGRVKAVQEGLGGIRDVILDGAQDIFVERFSGLERPMRAAQARIGFLGNFPRFFIESTGIILIVALAYWLSGREGGISGALPILGALAIGAQRLLPQMQAVYAAVSVITGSKSQLDDVLSLLALSDAPAAGDGANSLTFQGSQDVIALRDITFCYQDDSPPILKDLSLEIKRGARIGVVGKTGSGKSTLIDLTMGLLLAQEGHVVIAGTPLDARSRHSWMRRIAHVPQAIYLSDASIAENIAFGLAPQDIDLERLERAAEMAQLSDFVDILPQKYSTIVGERGVRISGGQRQRIGIARALYKKADVIVLDEATSALDTATETAVMEAIAGLGDDVTVLMIAHRISTLANCEAILRLHPNTPPQWISYHDLVSSEAQKIHEPSNEMVN